ncbi:hypothetical protein NOVOSPHI9U_630014 [Novosphingobium sp. 9U]|nr:hypothetical protein NOVOSPHI9U_630014 [Novosphingobium sp. 9U]
MRWPRRCGTNMPSRPRCARLLTTRRAWRRCSSGARRFGLGAERHGVAAASSRVGGACLGFLAQFRVQVSQQIAVRSAVERGLKRSISVEHTPTSRRQPCAAALGAARRRLDQRLSPAAVHGVHQQPGAAVTHVHGAGGAGDRSLRGNGVEQVGLAGTHRDLVAAKQLDLELQRVSFGHAYNLGRSRAKGQRRRLPRRSVRGARRRSVAEIEGKVPERLRSLVN